MGKPQIQVNSWLSQLSQSCQRGVGIGLLGLMGLTTAVWTSEALLSPPAAVAYTSRVTLFLNRETNESFEALVRRAEIVARAAVQRSFDADIMMTTAVVTIVGESQGVAVPIMMVEVDRNEWQARPDVTYWAEYYRTAESLMEHSLSTAE